MVFILISFDVFPSSYGCITLAISKELLYAIIKEIFDCDVSVNVHFIPVPMMSFYKSQGYDIKNYPITFDNYSREISLPIFYNLTNEMIETVINAVIKSVEKVI